MTDFEYPIRNAIENPNLLDIEIVVDGEHYAWVTPHQRQILDPDDLDNGAEVVVNAVLGKWKVRKTVVLEKVI